MNPNLNFLSRSQVFLRLLPLVYLAGLGTATASFGEPHDDHDHDHEHHDHGEEDHEAHDEHDDHDDHGIELDADVLEEFGIEVAPVTSGKLNHSVTVPGEIHFDRARYANITPQYPAIVTRLHADLGNSVKAGDILIEFTHSETLRPFQVTAPFDGEIVDLSVAPGESVDAGQSLLKLADTHRLRATLNIFQYDIHRVTKGMEVTIRCDDGAEHQATSIDFIAPQIDHHTRTGVAWATLENPRGEWKPGMHVTGTIHVSSFEVDLRIPRHAVVEMEGEPVVFVRTDHGFEKREIELGRSDSEAFEVLGGLEPGEVIAITHVMSLKAELGKGSFGGHHGHVH